MNKYVALINLKLLLMHIEKVKQQNVKKFTQNLV